MLTDSNRAIPFEQTVQALYPTSDAQRSAYAVVDAVDELQHQLGAYRALAALAGSDKRINPESLEQLQRSDLAVLLAVLNANMEAACARVREAAVSSAGGQ